MSNRSKFILLTWISKACPVGDPTMTPRVDMNVTYLYQNNGLQNICTICTTRISQTDRQTEVKSKVVPVLSTKQNAMKAYWGMEV
jgi:hypothetical protein